MDFGDSRRHVLQGGRLGRLFRRLARVGAGSHTTDLLHLVSVARATTATRMTCQGLPP